MSARILLLPGMNADVRIFDEIAARVPAAEVVRWIEPLPHESIANYARRLSAQLMSDASRPDDTIVCGVSFGGLIAPEVAIHCRAKACVLISSARRPGELPIWLQRIRPYLRFAPEPLLHAIGRSAAVIPKRMRCFPTAKLTKFADGIGPWNRWAALAVLHWRPSREAERVPIVQIHGDHDAVFPIRLVEADVVIRGGGHLIAVTHAAQISQILVEYAAAAPDARDARREMS